MPSPGAWTLGGMWMGKEEKTDAGKAEAAKEDAKTAGLTRSGWDSRCVEGCNRNQGLKGGLSPVLR